MLSFERGSTKRLKTKTLRTNQKRARLTVHKLTAEVRRRTLNKNINFVSIGPIEVAVALVIKPQHSM
jgi:hypothetical protein